MSIDLVRGHETTFKNIDRDMNRVGRDLFSNIILLKKFEIVYFIRKSFILKKIFHIK